MGVRVIAIGVALLAAITSPAAAQVASATTGPRWELEGVGGLSSLVTGKSTTVALPAAGAPLTTSSPIFPGRQTPSWFFGDGAQMLNDAGADLGLATRITPLDAALATLGLGSGSHAMFGARLRRVLTPRFSLEFGADVTALSLPHSLPSLVEPSRASFESALTGLLASGPFTNTTVRATSTGSGGAGRQVTATAAMTIALTHGGPLVPYATAGAGVIAGLGAPPAVTLEGRYQSTLAGVSPIDETDRVTIRYDQPATFVAVVGGGLRRDLSAGWGLRVDGRALIGANPTRVLLDASPSVVTGTPANFIESLTYPNIQFSNNASTGRASTLSAPALKDFAAVTGPRQTRVIFTLGIFKKF